MKRPCKLSILPKGQVAELARWLDEADIKSFQTPEGPLEGGDWGLAANAVIWVEEDDFPRAHDIALSFLHEIKARALRDKCQQCGYDLRAHSGPGRCPECGQSFDQPQRPFIRQCANCGEEVPGDFDICWNCGTSVDPDAASA